MKGNKMRRGTLQVGNEWTEGYWHNQHVEVGDAYQKPTTGEWVIITEVRDDYRGPEGERWFCQIRAAKESEIPELMPEEDEKKLFEDFFDATDFFG